MRKFLKLQISASILIIGFTFNAARSQESSQVSVSEMLAKLLTCCMMVHLLKDFGDESDEFKLSDDVLIAKQIEKLNIFLNKSPSKCDVLSRLVNSASQAEFLSLAVGYRACQAILSRTGIFEFSFYRGIPHQEIEPGSKYRLTFYTRAKDFYIVPSDDMETPEHTYLRINITLNADPGLGKIQSDRKLATLDCDGEWRNFSSAPKDISQLFRFGAKQFSLSQQDSCEKTLMNDLKLAPTMVMPRNLEVPHAP